MKGFQKTIFYKAITVIYRITVIVLAIVSAGVFYSDNYNLNDVTGTIGRIKDVIINIYKIVYDTLRTIFNLIFRNGRYNEKSDDSTPEPMGDYYISDIKEYFFKEETPWYQDGYLIGALINFIICIGGLLYVNWDSDSSIKDNVRDISSDCFDTLKSFKDLIINYFKRSNKKDRKKDESKESFDSNSNDSIKFDEIDISTVDTKILTDPYYYHFFKNSHDITNLPEFGSDEYDKMITKVFNSENKIIKYTLESQINLAESMDAYLDIPANQGGKEKIRSILIKSADEYKKFKSEDKMDEDEKTFFNERAYDLSHNDEVTPKGNVTPLFDTPKASTSKLPDEITKPKSTKLSETMKIYNEEGKEKFIKLTKDNQSKDSILDESSSFSSNLRGKLKTKDLKFKTDKDEDLVTESGTKVRDAVSKILNKTSEILNDEPELEDIIFTPELPPVNDNQSSKSNQLLKSISAFGKNKLKPTKTIVKDGSVKGSRLNILEDLLDDNPMEVAKSLLSANALDQIESSAPNQQKELDRAIELSKEGKEVHWVSSKNLYHLNEKDLLSSNLIYQSDKNGGIF